MTKILMVLAAAVLALPASALAQSPVSWTGKAVVEAASQSCNMQIGDSFTTGLQPLQVQQNPGPWANNGSFIGFQFDNEWMSLNIQGDLVPARGPINVILGRINMSGGGYVHGTTVTNIGIQPASFDATTKYLTVTMTINQFWGNPDCSVGIRARFTKVPDESNQPPSIASKNPFKARAQ